MTNVKRLYPAVEQPEPYKPNLPPPGYDGNPPKLRIVRDTSGKDRRVLTQETRIDRLQWLLDHRYIGDHHFEAGRKLQGDWQQAKVEGFSQSNIMSGGSAGWARSTLSDSKLDAGTRVKEALTVLPAETLTLVSLFLLPDDHPQSLERCAAFIKLHPRAALPLLKASLSLLSRHYGYG